VSYYVDPAIADDPNTRDLSAITLSYTFFNRGEAARNEYLRQHRMAAAWPQEARQ
jgi:cytochrome c oxidase assembly protein Cox11